MGTPPVGPCLWPDHHMHKVIIRDDDVGHRIFYYLPSHSVLGACAVVEDGPQAGEFNLKDYYVDIVEDGGSEDLMHVAEMVTVSQ